MEQFRRIGEDVGSLKALMVFQDNIQINQRQCFLLLDIFSSAYESIAEEMRHNLRFDEKHMKWRVLEQPLRELHRIFKDAEAYIRQCLDTKDWWAKAITLYQNSDCIEFHIHNLLACMPIVIEAIDIAGEISGLDQDEIQRKKTMFADKYKQDYRDWKLFKWRFGKQYLITQDFCNRFESAGNEDRWTLLHKISGKKLSGSTKYGKRLIDLFKSADGSESQNLKGKLLPSSVLVGSKDYQVRRRLGAGSQYKEIVWLGETFASRHFFGEIEPLLPEISLLLSLSHPNIVLFPCGFTDEEKKECFLIMELMSRDLCSYIKEICGARKRLPFSLPVAIDLMLQIARGMEYLHSKKIYHGDLDPSNILVKPRGISTEGYLQAKVSGFGLASVNISNHKNPSNQSGSLSFIWYAPEVLEEQEQGKSTEKKYAEKSDVYSFGMVCFELLTGKVPFEDSHLQGDKMSRNIRAGERPLFPFYSLRYVTNLTKKCWHSDPNQRPSFSSICRILRYIKRFLAMNPDYNSQLDPPVPMVDYCEIESGLVRKIPSWGSSEPSSISQIPFQMFVYRIAERERTSSSLKDTSESGSDGASICGDEIVVPADDPFSTTPEGKSLSSPDSVKKKLPFLKKSSDVKSNRLPGTPRGRSRPPQMTPCRSVSLRLGSESQLMAMSPRIRRTKSGHVSDSELS
ncbi:mitogen-activated protein kinase kinase kinase 7-like [Pyrus x bretschneideri]|uniref:mitogen-activated protein kinase kinase kinase 7-like n=1 Tax=Pyrus x bretschneideri TaxID=225117 RepID=UPI00202E9DDB|nr:mitogen-activated protein kinase kinase kinase 7-like [Pyrus x bretschneideri]